LPLVALAAALFAPPSVHSQSLLLTAKDFVLLGGTSVTVAGAGPDTFSNGNVGAAASISGFPPATVVNGTTIIGGVIVGQALNDLITARNTLSAMVAPPANNLTGVNGGDLATQILAPGVYKFDVAASLSLNGVLTLDAQGKNNVTWVINIGTSLTTGANAQVQFINLGSNGGKDNGLFWNAGSAFTFGATNVIAGNYLAGTDITFGTTVPATGSASGRALALAGVSFDGTATLDVLGGPGNGDLTGGIDANGNLSGYVLLSSDGAYSQGISNVVLTPGSLYNTAGVTIDGGSSDAALVPASLTVFGTTATLTGINTYTGGTVVDGGTLITGSANLPTDGAVSLVDSNSTGTAGQLIFDQASNGSFGGVISGTGSVTKQNIGILTLTGINTYTGGTTITGGSLALSGSGTLGDTTGALAVTGGTLDLGGTSQTVGAVTLGGGTISNGTLTGVSYTSTGGSADANLAGSGVVFTNTSGTTTLTGLNTYTGGTVINGGTVSASTASMPTSGGVILAVGSILILDDASDVTYADTISGGGTLQKNGVGALTLGNTTSALIDLQAGSMYLGSEIATTDVGATTVASGALLGGNGTINGDLLNNGIVSPGFSPGTIIVAGNYTQGAGGTLVIQFASAASFDKLLVTGSATLAGTLQVDLLGGYNPAGQSFQILTAGGGVVGTFTTVTGSAALTANIAYNPNDVTVSFTQTSFVTFALTPNQKAVANAAQASPAITAALNLVPLASQMPAALNALSPQGYEIWSDIAFSHATSLTDRLAQKESQAQGRENFYYEAGQQRGMTKGDLDVGSSKYDSNSGLVGGNFAICPNLTLGGFFEYTETSSDLGSSGSNTNIKDKMFGVRAAWTKDQWFAHAVVAYGFDDYKSTRSIVFPGTAAVATSSTKGHQWIADISGGRRFQAGILTLSPFVGLLASRWEANGFTETGAGAFNNSVGSQTANSLRTQAGLEGSLNFQIGSVLLRPHVRAAWLHELADNRRSMDAAFGAVNYAISTQKPQRDSALLGAGLDLAFGSNVMLYSEVSVQTGGVSRVMGEWHAGVSVSF
jgi:autotransporter-associated beta strand protein